MEPRTYKHPDTGEEIEIPQGSEIERDEAGNIRLWRNPPVTPRGELHPDQVAGYEPKFDRAGTHRRVLMHVTDEEDVTRSALNAQRYLVPSEALGPRNTAEAVAFAVARDQYTPSVPHDFRAAVDQVKPMLEELVSAGLLSKRDDGSYEVTDAGKVELRN